MSASPKTGCVAWLTDIHLEFSPPLVREQLFEGIGRADLAAVLIGGDISTAHNLVGELRALQERLDVPVYFVLGNHDYYDGSIRGVRRKVTTLCDRSTHLHWLPRSGIVELTPTTCLIGHGGWADGRSGNYSGSDVMLNDYLVIQELSHLGKELRLEIMQGLARAAADHFEALLPAAFDKYERVLVLMHVPPFEAATWHEGRISDPDWLPHFCCTCAGDALRGEMERHPDSEMLVLCGHTHSAGTARILPNLHVITGSAIYGHPRIQSIIDIGATMDEILNNADQGTI